MSKEIAIVKCGDCNAEITRSNPVEDSQKAALILSAPLQNFRCNNKDCRATYSDMNANISFEWIPAPGRAA